MNDTEHKDAYRQITDLVHQYALNIRIQHPADCVGLFTADAVFEVREAANPAALSSAIVRSRVEGREAIGQYIAAAAGSGIVVCPMIHNLLIEVAGDEASSSCLMTTRTWPGGHELIGEYRDAFLKSDSGWLFQSRIYTIYRG